MGDGSPMPYNYLWIDNLLPDVIYVNIILFKWKVFAEELSLTKKSKKSLKNLVCGKQSEIPQFLKRKLLRQVTKFYILSVY